MGFFYCQQVFPDSKTSGEVYREVLVENLSNFSVKFSTGSLTKKLCTCIILIEKLDSILVNFSTEDCYGNQTRSIFAKADFVYVGRPVDILPRLKTRDSIIGDALHHEGHHLSGRNSSLWL